MLVLQASEEQEQVFQKLIQTMGEQVVWNGRFLIKDDELILEGTVRSLIFQFETKKVTTNLVDLAYKEEAVLDISRHPTLKDLINMVLYAFGKWGTLRGLNVQQDYPQLNQLFAKILNTFYIEPSFRKENFRFYKVGVRVTYEEVLQTVLEYEKKQAEDPAAESQGLWHRLIWKNSERPFHKEETTLLERVEDRIGNNFYLVGYQCPKCQEKLHMAVYPDGKEVRIDTEEKGVYLARVYTCTNCHCFYTPRPDRLISEGLIYEMDFSDDSKAYEDYLELMGYYGERAANFKYNEYEAVRKQRLLKEARQKADENSSAFSQGQPDRLFSPQDALRQMEQFGQTITDLPKDVLWRFAHRVEEGFYPDAAVAKYEKQILEEVKQRGSSPQAEAEPAPNPGMIPDTELNTASNTHDAQGVPVQSTLKQTAKQHAGQNKTVSQMQHHPSNTLNHKTQANDFKHTPIEDLAPDGQTLDNRAPDGQTLDNPAPNDLTLGNSSPDDLTLGDLALDDAGQAYQTNHASTEAGSRIAQSANRIQKPTKHDTITQPEHGNVKSVIPIEHTEHVKQPESAGNHYGPGQTAMPANTFDEEHLQTYTKRIEKLERLSPRQKQELKKQIQNDTKLDIAEKQSCRLYGSV